MFGGEIYENKEIYCLCYLWYNVNGDNIPDPKNIPTLPDG